jgi:galactose oxidase-like protein
MRQMIAVRAFVALVCLVVLLVFLTPLAVAQANVQGLWTTLPTTMPINPVHVALLHSGKVLVVSGSGNVAGNTNYQAAIWDPVTSALSTQSLSWDMFCNGMVVLPDGRPLIVGGTLQYDPFYGEKHAAVYDPSTNTFSDVQSMQHGRWYPTTTTLGDGRVMAFSGLDVNGATTPTVEIYSPASGWSAPTNAPWTPPLYPRLHLLPNGKVFYSGPGTGSAMFNPSTQAWTTNVARTNYGSSRTYGTSVLLPLTPANGYTPRVMIMGGGNPATTTTEIIDLSQATPVWQYGPDMSQGRIEMNAVILPDGKVLAMGGSVKDEDATTASLNADLYNPATNTFSSAGANGFPRLYHSVALLLPDASVWLAGGNPVRGFYQTQMEIYQPPYLFTTDVSGNVVPAPRPTISSAPGTISYGGSFTVQTPNASTIGSAVLVRPGSPTHAFDMDQRLVGLQFSATSSTTLSVTAPVDGNLAPPGYYMLFLVDNAGVPSVASWAQVQPATTGLTLAVTPTSRSVVQGNQTSYTATVTVPVGSAPVSFSVTGLPPGGTATFTPATLSASGSTTMRVATLSSTPPGTYPLTISASDGSTTQSVTVNLVVKLQGSFTLTVSPTSQTVNRNSSTTYTVTVTPSNGFHWTVNLSVKGTGTHIKATLNPATIDTSGTSTLTLTVDSRATLGSYTLTAVGKSGTMTRSTKFTLVVQ